MINYLELAKPPRLVKVNTGMKNEYNSKRPKLFILMSELISSQFRY